MLQKKCGRGRKERGRDESGPTTFFVFHLCLAALLSAVDMGFSKGGAWALSEPAGSVAAMCKLSNWCSSLVALRHVRSEFLDQGSKVCSLY